MAPTAVSPCVECGGGGVGGGGGGCHTDIVTEPATVANTLPGCGE